MAQGWAPSAYAVARDAAASGTGNRVPDDAVGPVGERDIPGPAVRIVQTVFPNQADHYGRLFGGEALKLMDEAGFIAASRWARQALVTVSAAMSIADRCREAVSSRALPCL